MRQMLENETILMGLAYGDTGVTSNDWYDNFGRFGRFSDDLGDESRCTDDVQSRNAKQPRVAVRSAPKWVR